MDSLDYSRPKRVYFDHGGETTCYEVRNRLAFLQGPQEQIEVRSQLLLDGISEDALREFILTWLVSEPSASCVMLKHRGDAYALFVMANVEAERDFADLQISINAIRQLFAERAVTIAILDESQRDASAFWDAVKFEPRPMRDAAA